MLARDFFVPIDSTTFDHVILTALNIVIILLALFVFTYFIVALFKSKDFAHTSVAKERKVIITTFSITTVAVFLLCLLSIYSQGGADNLVLYRLSAIFNPIFGIYSFTSSPFHGWFGLNLFARFIMLMAMILALRLGWKVAKSFSTEFANFLKEKPTKENEEGIEKIAETNSHTEPQSSVDIKGKGNFTKLIMLFSILAPLATYIFGTEAVSDRVVDLAALAFNALATILPLSNLQPIDSDVVALLSNFGLVLLNIFIAAFYIIIGLTLLVLLRALREKRDGVVAWIHSKKGKIFVFFSVVAGSSIAILILFLVINNYTALEQFFFSLLGESGWFVVGEPLSFVLSILIITLALCAVLFVATLFISLLFLLISFMYQYAAMKFKDMENIAKKSNINGFFGLLGYTIFQESDRCIC